MEEIIKILVYIHAFFGGIGLFTGVGSVMVKKGSAMHKKMGKLFSIGMIISSLISVPISWMPNHENLFLIGLFTIYLVLAGNRALTFKTKEKADLIDKIISGTMLSLSILMSLIGIYGLLNNISFSILYLFFGCFGLFLTIKDFRFYKNPKNEWLMSHISKMIGALIASITAFIIAGLGVGNVIAWTLPTVIGTIYIIYWKRKKMRLPIVLVLMIVFNNSAWGQENQKELLSHLNSDLNYFQNVIESSHPNPYRYISKSSLDSLFIESHFDTSDTLSYIELERRIRHILSKIGSIHTYIVKPRRQSNKVFPFQFHIQQNEAFVIKDLDNELDINKQYKVLSINGNTTENIISTMLDYRPSDGYNKTFKFQLINSDSWFSKMYEFYFDSDSLKTITLIDTAQNTIKVTRKMKQINVDNNKTKDKKFDSQFGNSVKLKYYDNNVAVLEISNFNGFPIIGKNINGNHYKKAFKEVVKKNVQTLVIDLRNNLGGDAQSGYRLVSYFLGDKHKINIQHHKGKIFKYAKIESKIGLVLNTFLGNLFSGRIPKCKDRKSFVNIKPRKNIYKGELYVLTNGLTVSTASNVASIFKQKTDAVLMGEESGGGANNLDAYVFPKIKLPFSKIEIQIPQYNIDLDLIENKGYGVTPNKITTPSFESIVNKEDWLLKEILQMTTNSDNQ